MKNVSGRKSAHVGEIIRRRREQLGLTQEELAARLGAERFLDSLIRHLENGTAKVPPARVLAFARGLQLDEVWFVALVMRGMPGFGSLHAWLFGPGGLLRERLEQGQNVVRASFGNDVE